MADMVFFKFSGTTVILLLLAFYGATFFLSTFIGQKKENADAYMVSSGKVGFGISAASMTATWIWAASFYGAATSGYNYGLSGPIHYGLWGALMILFIYPYGLRFRKLAPNAHTLAEVMQARHGSGSQLILALSNVMGSLISLMVNFTAAGALVSVLSPLSFQTGIIIAGLGVLSYTLWSGFRASILTDFAQVVAMMSIAVIIIPWVYFSAGGSEVFMAGLDRVTEQQAQFFSSEAILKQGAPFFVAVLAYAIGNQTIAQRLFAVRQDLIKPTFITATLGYGSIVIGLGMLGLMALLLGVVPQDGDPNNIVPQMASSYLPPIMVALFFILVIGSLSSTADSDLSALSAIFMTDIYGRNIAKNNSNPQKMLLIGRVTMIVATVVALVMASQKVDILTMLVFVGALWGAIVFPVIASCYWKRVTNAAFVYSVVVALVLFSVVRFELIPSLGLTPFASLSYSFFEIVAAIGGGAVLGLMAFGFFGHRVGIIVGVIAAVICSYYFMGFMRDHTVLLSSLVAYGASTIICVALSLVVNKEFDFDLIGQRITSFQKTDPNPNHDNLAK